MRVEGGRATVMTWNIWWRFGPRWRQRQPALIETLRNLDPDVVALQEVWRSDETTQRGSIESLAHSLAGVCRLEMAKKCRNDRSDTRLSS
jgi:endonuclease/exonuclease/phosphatase family metal-dependent hydrolase